MAWFMYLAKAIYAGVVVLLGGVLAALQASPDVGLSDLPAEVWITVGLATVIAVGGVFGITNADKPGSTG